MICKTHKAPTLWVAFSSATLLAGHVSAQTAPPALPPAATPAPYKSAFEGYRAYSDAPMLDWKAANDEVARIGGWREYARQAQNLEPQPENTSTTRAGEVKPKAQP
ncbi:MAG: hypothetical protein EAZ34_02500 [Polaromonas sp.]|nr:MAG: hypothetical protein EAZ34_02500 [Polaromonas sp.]